MAVASPAPFRTDSKAASNRPDCCTQDAMAPVGPNVQGDRISVNLPPAEDVYADAYSVWTAYRSAKGGGYP